LQSGASPLIGEADQDAIVPRLEAGQGYVVLIVDHLVLLPVAGRKSSAFRLFVGLGDYSISSVEHVHEDRVVRIRRS